MFHSFNSFIQQCNTHFYSHRTIETHSNVINPSTRFFFLFSNPHYWRNRYGNKAKCYQLTTYFLVVVGVNSLVLNYLFLILHDSFFFFSTLPNCQQTEQSGKTLSIQDAFLYWCVHDKLQGETGRNAGWTDVTSVQSIVTNESFSRLSP